MNRLEELYAQQAAITKAIEEEKNKAVKAVVEQIQSMINMYGLSDFQFKWQDKKAQGKKERKKAPAQFSDGSNQWSGRGKQPLWVREKVQELGSLDAFRSEYRI